MMELSSLQQNLYMISIYAASTDSAAFNAWTLLDV